MNDLRQFFFSLDSDQREAFAAMADTTVNYIQKHLVLPNPEKRKSPSKTTMKNIASACQQFRDEGLGAPTYQDILDFFYGEEGVA
jgi:hypothetical protein